jgi:hypothetical protein
LTGSGTFATALLVLVLLEGHQAYAIPTTITGAPDDQDCACIQVVAASRPVVMAPPPASAYPASGFVSIAAIPGLVTGNTTFSPMLAAGDNSGASTLAFETISTIRPVLDDDHAKPGKLAADGSVSTGGSSVYIGTSHTLALQEGASEGSASSGYAVAASDARSAGNDSIYAVTNAAFVPTMSGRAAVPPGTRTKVSKSVQPPEPVFSSSLAGSGTTNTPKSGQQSLINFGTSGLNASRTMDLAVTNLAADGSGSDLTIEGYAIAGADPASFSAAITSGSVVLPGGTLVIPLTVVGTGPGDLTSTLTIFTNQGTSLGGAGEAFNYLLDPMVVIGRSASAPEPTSLAVFSVGLAGLASMRLRRRARQHLRNATYTGRRLR